jgi:hypothetical protein
MQKIDRRITSANSGLTIGGVSYSADSLSVNSNVLLRMNICGKIPAHRQAAKR